MGLDDTFVNKNLSKCSAGIHIESLGSPRFQLSTPGRYYKLSRFSSTTIFIVVSLIAVAVDHNNCVAGANLLALSLKTGTWAYM